MARASDGFRKVLAKEFHEVYVYDLRGNQRTSGETSQREGGKVFGSGSRAGVAVLLLVKRPGPVTGPAAIHYYDIGDYLTREQKLETVGKAFSSTRSSGQTSHRMSRATGSTSAATTTSRLRPVAVIQSEDAIPSLKPLFTSSHRWESSPIVMRGSSTPPARSCAIWSNGRWRSTTSR